MNQNQSNTVLNDQDMMEDLLTQQKYLITSYSSFLPEASCPQLRQVLTDNFTECADSQYNVFDRMNQLGWYQTKNAPEPEIQAARQKFQQLKSQMG
jgi:spore coat protein F